MDEEEIEKRYKDNVNFDEITTDDELTLTYNIQKEKNYIIFQYINFFKEFIIRNNTIIYMDYDDFIEKKFTLNQEEEYLPENETETFKIIFINCRFYNSFEYSGLSLYSLEFDKCNFNDITLKNLYKNKYINEISFIESNINSLDIDNCEIDGNFDINKQENKAYEIMNSTKIIKNNNQITNIKRIKINNSIFKNNFYFYKCIVQHIDIKNTNFEKMADFFRCTFTQNVSIFFDSIKFEGITLFKKCIFDNQLILGDVNFLDYVSFRESKFKKGLVLDSANIAKEMHFFGIKGLENIKGTSQETYRIIKYNFTKVGNIIEANKYHALELKRKKLKLKLSDEPLEWIVFYINSISSNFGTNWLLTFCWIIFVGFLTMISMNLDKLINLYNIRPIFYFDLSYYSERIITKTFTYMSIAHTEDFKKHPIILFFNKVTLGYLYYQFVMAVRKDTRK